MQPGPLFWIAGAAAAGLLVGWILSALVWRGGGRRARLEAELLEARLRRDVESLEGQLKELGEVHQALPDLVRQLLGAGSRRAVAPLALKLLDQIFRPVQAAFFWARAADRKLSLGAAQGLPPPLRIGYEVPYGQGRVGYVAETALAMDDADFGNVTATARRQIEAAAASGLQVEVAAPVQDENGDLIGVLCAGSLRQGKGQEKRLARMVAGLAGLAISHVARLRATQQAADLDVLTGAFNKRHFQQRLGDELHRAQREHKPLSLLLLDIDHFKAYNDNNGHVEGDEVLKQVGHVLRHSVREDDAVARYGGEEFVVLFPGAAKTLAVRLAETLRKAIEAQTFRHGHRQPLGAVTLSGGVATYPEDAQNGVDLIRAADQALYEAKGAGRNRVLGANPSYLT